MEQVGENLLYMTSAEHKNDQFTILLNMQLYNTLGINSYLAIKPTIKQILVTFRNYYSPYKHSVWEVLHDTGAHLLYNAKMTLN